MFQVSILQVISRNKYYYTGNYLGTTYPLIVSPRNTLNYNECQLVKWYSVSIYNKNHYYFTT